MMNDQHPCEKWAEKLAARHQEDLAPEEYKALQEHLASCPACAAQYAAYRSLEEMIRELPSPEPPPSFLPTLRALRERARRLPVPSSAGQFEDLGKPSPQRRLALVIGVNAVARTDMPSLRYAERDAQELAAVLQQRAGVELIAPPILGKEATTDNIFRSLDRLVEECRETDEVILYFAGHGFWPGTGSQSLDLMFCLSDWDGPERVSHALSVEQISRWITEKLKASRVLLILDACQSARLTDARSKSPSPWTQERLAGYFARSEHAASLALEASAASRQLLVGPGENEPLPMLLRRALLHEGRVVEDDRVSDEAADLQQVYRFLEEAIT